MGSPAAAVETVCPTGVAASACSQCNMWSTLPVCLLDRRLETTAQNRFRCWCWLCCGGAAGGRELTCARDSTLTDCFYCCCCSICSLLSQFSSSALFPCLFLRCSPPSKLVLGDRRRRSVYVFLRTGSSSSTFPMLQRLRTIILESRCLPLLPFLCLSLSSTDESKCSCRRRVRRTAFYFFFCFCFSFSLSLSLR